MMQRQAVPRSLALDYAVGLCGIWISSGFFLDAWAHGHVPVESFFTPYHAAFYSGMLAMLLVLGGFALRGRRRGYAWADAVPAPYRLALIGIPIFLGAALGDMLWHRVFGLEEGVERAPEPHASDSSGWEYFFWRAVRSAAFSPDREAKPSLRLQLPLVFGLATWLTLAHFGTAYAFDPAGANASRATPDRAVHTQLSHRAGHRVLQDFSRDARHHLSKHAD